MQGHVLRSKVKVTASTWSLCIPDSCPTNNFIMRSGIWKLFGRNDHCDQMLCYMEELCPLVKGQGHGRHFEFRHSRIVQPVTSFQTLVGFENCLAEMIITTRQCVVCKNHVARSKIKVTVHTHSLCKGISCSAHNFILHDGIWKLYGTNDHQDKALCPAQEPCCYVKGQVHSLHLQFMHKLKWNLFLSGSLLCCGACLRDGAIIRIWFSICLYGPIKALSYSRN